MLTLELALLEQEVVHHLYFRSSLNENIFRKTQLLMIPDKILY